MVRTKTYDGHESGITLIETLIALALVGALAIVFLGGLFTTTKVAYITDERGTAAGLAQLQIEWVKAANYVYEASEYSLAPVPENKDYIGYSTTIAAVPLHTPDDGIQRITVNVYRSGEQVFKLASYKVDR